MLGSSTLLARPLRNPLLDLFVGDEIPAIRGLETAIDLLLYVNVVLNVFVRRLIWKRVEQAANFFLRDGSCHRRIFLGFILVASSAGSACCASSPATHHPYRNRRRCVSRPSPRFSRGSLDPSCV